MILSHTKTPRLTAGSVFGAPYSPRPRPGPATETGTTLESSLERWSPNGVVDYHGGGDGNGVKYGYRPCIAWPRRAEMGHRLGLKPELPQACSACQVWTWWTRWNFPLFSTVADCRQCPVCPSRYWTQSVCSLHRAFPSSGKARNMTRIDRFDSLRPRANTCKISWGRGV